MRTIEKIDFIIKTTKWSEKRFIRKFYLPKDALDKWHGGAEITEKDVKNICKYFRLEPKDFLDDSLNIFLKSTERFCVFSLHEEEITSLEDYPHEDNARYEEKD